MDLINREAFNEHLDFKYRAILSLEKFFVLGNSKVYSITYIKDNILKITFTTRFKEQPAWIDALKTAL